MASNKQHELSRRLFRHLSVRDAIERADLIVGFGVFDMRVPDHCASLFLSGYAPCILFTGGFGAGSGSFKDPEAVEFRRRAQGAGVPRDHIIVEPSSGNTLENVLNTRTLLAEKCIAHGRIILVAQPHRQRRVWLTCRKWLRQTGFVNSPPETDFDSEVGRFGGVRGFTESMIGEVRRIELYGERGDLERENIPPWMGDLLEGDAVK
jgi:uncharacterized SAM-binding protein YcdF (DUF218 family)